MGLNPMNEREARLIAAVRKNDQVRSILTTFLELDEADQLEFAAQAKRLRAAKRQADRTQGIDIPRGPSTGGQHKLTSEEQQQLRHAAVDGVAPLDEYLRIATEILEEAHNKKGPCPEATGNEPDSKKAGTELLT